MRLIYYKDAECTKPFPVDAEGKQKVVSPDAIRQGESGKMAVFLRNESAYDYQITNVIFKDEHITLQIEKPYLKSGEVTKIDVVWKIPEHLEEPFKDGWVLDGDYIIKGE